MGLCELKVRLGKLISGRGKVTKGAQIWEGTVIHPFMQPLQLFTEEERNFSFCFHAGKGKIERLLFPFLTIDDHDVAKIFFFPKSPFSLTSNHRSKKPEGNCFLSLFLSLSQANCLSWRDQWRIWETVKSERERERERKRERERERERRRLYFQ